jgi:acetyltransferase-like isoleucine patch superfamily enzyme
MFNIIDCEQSNIESNTMIGQFNYIKANRLEMKKGSSINKFNKISSINIIQMGLNSIINKKNVIFGSRSDLNLNKDNENLYLGENSEILISNHFDVSEKIEIGNDVVFGGINNEIWTHGFDSERNKKNAAVKIGNNVFFGSGCKILPGVEVADQVEFGSGTIVSSSVTEKGFYVSSQLLRKR